MVREWRDVKGFEDLYMISNDGFVLSKRTNKVRKSRKNKCNGYFQVMLCGHDSKVMKYIHRLVAEAFIDNPDGLECINHKNEIKTDNSVENLEWCTKRYNNFYNGKIEKCYVPIIQRDPVTGKETYWKSCVLAERAGIANKKNISACCRGLRNFAGGYEWRYANV